jgi:hypothetical protein
MGRRLAVGAFRAVAVLHAVLAVVQPVAAGAVLQASVAGLEVHRAVGSVVGLVGMVLVPLAVLAWRPGRLPAWPIAVAVGLVVAEVAQIALGYTGLLAVHVPLGVAIVATSVALAWWVLRARPEIAPGAPATG